MRALAAAALAIPLLAAAAQERPTLYLVGDSTMADRADTVRNPERGWGQALPRFLDDGVQVRNAAMNGRSSKSFIDEGRWAAVLAQLEPGDCVLVQFGHNDEKAADPARYTSPDGGYRDNLRRFVAEARAKGAEVALLTPIVRRRFGAGGALEDTHGAYPAAVRRVARETGVPLLDLQRLTHALVDGEGMEGSKALYVWVPPGAFELYPQGRQDDTHLSAEGAARVARLAARALRQSGLAIARHVRPDA